MCIIPYCLLATPVHPWLTFGHVGPHERSNRKEGSAFALFSDAFYNELQKNSELQAKKPDKVTDFLPDNVVYDPAENTLSYTYLFGEPVKTNLSKLTLLDVDLCKEEAWHKPSAPNHVTVSLGELAQ